MEFGIPPTNLEATDTSQLLALYCAKEALIDAGYWSETADFSNTGIILGYFAAYWVRFSSGISSQFVGCVSESGTILPRSYRL